MSINLAYERYRILREYIQHEDQNINNRMTWMIAFQGILFAGFSVSVSLFLEKYTYGPKFVLSTICLVGLGVSWLSYIGIKAASIAIEEIAKYGYAPHYLSLPKLTGGGEKRAMKYGFRYCMWLPRVFLFIWISLFSISTFCSSDYLKSLFENDSAPKAVRIKIVK